MLHPLRGERPTEDSRVTRPQGRRVGGLCGRDAAYVHDSKCGTTLLSPHPRISLIVIAQLTISHGSSVEITRWAEIDL